MLYPTISEYISSIKDAENNFDKRANLRPLININGDPIFTSGNFAVVFKMRDIRTNKYYAVKSFIKDQERRAESYKLISKELQSVTSPYLVKYEYLDKELFVDSSQSKETEYPVVVMDWIEGKTLDVYVKELCESEDKSQLESLSFRFNQLATWLLEQSFAHGDLKHDNILVRQDGTLVLVDYDGMYVPAMKGQKARELGSPDYRHPKRTADNFNANIDLFPLITIALALKALSLKPDLYKKYNPKDYLLFTEKDFNDIANSLILKEISSLIYDKSLAGLYSAFLFSLHFPSEKNAIFDLFRLSSYKNIGLRALSKLKNFASDHPAWFISMISTKYPLSEVLIERNKDNWIWLGLSLNESLFWSFELIEKYYDKWDYRCLSRAKSLPWSIELIEKYKDKWNWRDLSCNESLLWSVELIEKHIDKWCWASLSWNKSLPWSVELIEKYYDRWNWEGLSRNISLPWSVELIEKYYDEWDWELLSCNESLLWSVELIEKNIDKWDWEQEALSCNESLPWSIELIEKFKDKWDWSGLSCNEYLPWSNELIEGYKRYWTWERLSCNESLSWSIELIEKYKDEWDWSKLSDNKSLSWSLELIEKNRYRWNWSGLSGNEYLPWSLELIEKYKDKWDWNKLIYNSAIYTTIFKDLPSSTIDELMQTITNR